MQLPIPLGFVKSLTTLTWREVELGLQNRWLTDDAAIQLAADCVSPSPDVLELAALLPSEKYRAGELVHRLAEADSEVSPGKWLFLLLAWLYANRDRVDEPFAVVEQLYADFDYPAEMEDFVRYMPAKDPSAVGEKYLLQAWERYLEEARRAYAPEAAH